MQPEATHSVKFAFALCAFDRQYRLVDGKGEIEPVNFNVLIVQRDSILQGVLQQNRRDRVVHGVVG